MDYLVAYRHHGDMALRFYNFTADDAEHAIEQFRSAEPDESKIIVFVVLI